MADDLSNGHASDGMAEIIYQDFTIGGKAIRVPELMLWDLDRLREPMLALNGDMWWADYAMTVCKIIAVMVPSSGNPEELYKKCSIREARELSTSWGELLLKSGFEPPSGEAVATGESPGIGTLMPSSPTSQFEESAVAIQGELKEPSV